MIKKYVLYFMQLYIKDEIKYSNDYKVNYLEHICSRKYL